MSDLKQTIRYSAAATGTATARISFPRAMTVALDFLTADGNRANGVTPPFTNLVPRGIVKARDVGIGNCAVPETA